VTSDNTTWSPDAFTPHVYQKDHWPGLHRQAVAPARALAHGYRAEMVRAARGGLAFAPETGEPEPWAAQGPEPVTWYQHGVAYAEMTWPRLAPHSPTSLADALAQSPRC